MKKTAHTAAVLEHERCKIAPFAYQIALRNHDSQSDFIRMTRSGFLQENQVFGVGPFHAIACTIHPAILLTKRASIKTACIISHFSAFVKTKTLKNRKKPSFAQKYLFFLLTSGALCAIIHENSKMQ